MAYPYQFGGGMNMASPQIRQKQNKGTTPKKNQGQTSLLRRLQINMLGSPQAGPATRTLPYQVGQPQAGPAMKTLPYVVNQAATMADNRVATPGQIQNVIGAAFDAPPSAGELERIRSQPLAPENQRLQEYLSSFRVPDSIPTPSNTLAGAQTRFARDRAGVREGMVGNRVMDVHKGGLLGGDYTPPLFQDPTPVDPDRQAAALAKMQEFQAQNYDAQGQYTGPRSTYEDLPQEAKDAIATRRADKRQLLATLRAPGGALRNRAEAAANNRIRRVEYNRTPATAQDRMMAQMMQRNPRAALEYMASQNRNRLMGRGQNLTARLAQLQEGGLNERAALEQQGLTGRAQLDADTRTNIAEGAYGSAENIAGTEADVERARIEADRRNARAASRDARKNRQLDRELKQAEIAANTTLGQGELDVKREEIAKQIGESARQFEERRADREQEREEFMETLKMQMAQQGQQTNTAQAQLALQSNVAMYDRFKAAQERLGSYEAAAQELGYTPEDLTAGMLPQQQQAAPVPLEEQIRRRRAIEAREASSRLNRTLTYNPTYQAMAGMGRGALALANQSTGGLLGRLMR